MKKILILSLMMGRLLFAEEVIKISQVDKNIENYFLSGKAHDLIIEVPKGTILPLTVFLHGDLIDIAQQEQKNIVAHVKQTVFVKRVDDAFLFSIDKKNWKPLSQFITGNIGVSVGNSDQGLIASLGGEANLRK